MRRMKSGLFGKIYLYIKQMNRNWNPGPNAAITHQYNVALFTAIHNGDVSTVRRYFEIWNLNEITDIHWRERMDILGQELIKVCARADYAMAELLITIGANIHVNRGEAIKYAVINGDIAMLILLINSGATPEEIVVQGLHKACMFCHESIVEYILTQAIDLATYSGVSQDEYEKFMVKLNDSLLMAIPAPCTNSARIISLLLDMGGANPNYVDSMMGLSVLAVASVSEKIDIMRILVDHGADPNINNGVALIMAVNANKVRAVHFLLSETNIDDGIRTRALRTAEDKGHTEIATLLAAP